MIEAELRIKVVYTGVRDPQEAREILEELVQHAVDNGLLSGEGPGEIEEYSFTVNAHEVPT